MSNQLLNRLTRKSHLAFVSLIIFTASLSSPAQQPPKMVISPEVAADGRVTFRFRNPDAKDVKVYIEGQSKPLDMQKDADGVWTVTTQPMEPDFYGYSFIADGMSLFDPMNPVRKPNYLYTSSEVHVPGPSTLPWSTPRRSMERAVHSANSPTPAPTATDRPIVKATVLQSKGTSPNSSST